MIPFGWVEELGGGGGVGHLWDLPVGTAVRLFLSRFFFIEDLPTFLLQLLQICKGSSNAEKFAPFYL